MSMSPADETWNEIQKLREENEQLKDRLDHSVAKIMKLQGGIDQITDGNVKKRYEVLYSAIQEWVTEIELALIEDSRDFRGSIFHGLLADERRGHTLLYRLGFWEKDQDNGTSEMIWSQQSKDFVKMEWLGTLDTCLHVILSRHIWCFLEDNIFRRPYPIGLGADEGRGIRYIRDAVKYDVDGRTDIDSDPHLRANKWMARVMKTLVMTTTFRDDKELHMERLRSDLKRHLRPLVDSSALNKHLQGLEKTVLYPAVNLKEELVCSSTEYKYKGLETSLHHRTREDNPIRDYTLKEVVEWRDQDSYIDIFGNLFPGIYRVGFPGEKDLSIVKPVILVLNEESMGKYQRFKHARSRTPDSRHRSPAKSTSRGSSPSHTARRSVMGRQPGDRAHTLKRDKRDEAPSEHSRFARLGRAMGIGRPDTNSEARAGREGRPVLYRSRTGERMGGLTSKEGKTKEKKHRRFSTIPPDNSQADETSLYQLSTHGASLRSSSEYITSPRQSVSYDAWSEASVEDPMDVPESFPPSLNAGSVYISPRSAIQYSPELKIALEPVSGTGQI